MKKILMICTLLICGSIAIAQSHHEVIKEGNDVFILKGLVNFDDIKGNGNAEWFAANQQGYTPNALAVEALKKHGSSTHIIAFVGTWCDDTKFILPKFYSLMQASNFPQQKVSMIGVDRDKKTHSYLTEALNVENVPTFIVMKDGKELGRVVEYGKYGMWDKELGEVIKQLDN